MAEWAATIYGVPIGKARARTVRLPNGMISSYTPKKTRRWEESIAFQATQTRPDQLLDGPLACQIVFWLPRPQSRPKRDRYPDRKPDLDNLAKAVLDALEGVVYTQDSRIVTKVLHKRYVQEANGGNSHHLIISPCVQVRLVEVDACEPDLVAWVPVPPVEVRGRRKTG